MFSNEEALLDLSHRMRLLGCSAMSCAPLPAASDSLIPHVGTPTCAHGGLLPSCEITEVTNTTSVVGAGCPSWALSSGLFCFTFSIKRKYLEKHWTPVFLAELQVGVHSTLPALFQDVFS